ncbi:MAG: peptidyl-prolyl cis-trans isomerase PpiA precursor [Gemmatimonadetes bacterium]|nr:peptidyl-prolyl cis-trans isomerase PpiA precursor [Gemmatimonadota bacterium]
MLQSMWTRYSLLMRKLFMGLLAASLGCSSPGTETNAALLKPDDARLAAPAPDSFVVHFETSRGDFDMKVRRSWAPLGAGRLYYLVSNGFYNGARFFRVLEGFMVQFGVNGDPAVSNVWKDRRLGDDPFAKHSNRRGTVSFANEGPNTRNTQLFVNYKDNPALDKDGFVPVGEVVAGMTTVDSLYDGYGEGPPGGIGPNQTRIVRQGNAYLVKFFPFMDYVKTARVSSEWRAP